MAKAGKELYVGSLSYDVTEYELQKLFAVSGTVTSMHLIRDPETGQFKGCGYVRMSTEAEARDAIDSLDGAWLIDKHITVSYANPQKMKAGGGGAKGVPRWQIEAAEKKAAAKKAAAAAAAAPAKPASKPAAKPAAKSSTSPAAKPAGTRPAAAKAGAAKAGAARPAGAAKPAGAKPGSRPGGAAKPGSRTGKR